MNLKCQLLVDMKEQVNVVASVNGKSMDALQSENGNLSSFLEQHVPKAETKWSVRFNRGITTTSLAVVDVYISALRNRFTGFKMVVEVYDGQKKPVLGNAE